MRKKVAVLGSTGSIGRNTLDVARHLDYEVVALAAQKNIDLLELQAKVFTPQLVAVYDKERAKELQRRLPSVRVVGGQEGLEEAATLQEVDLVVSAMVGSIGLLPTLKAIEKRKQIALANKEVLVMAGEYVMRLAQEKGVQIVPIDSEHSAIFQCMEGKQISDLRRMILTASGGPFLDLPASSLATITVEQALAHPTWQMGPKNTIDSSTLMNKGLEIIEAHFLFGVAIEKIEVVIHPQSVIHSLIEMIDGSLLAQLSAPNMIMPIQYALTYPERKIGMLPPFDFRHFSTLEFVDKDPQKTLCLDLAFEALRQGGNAPCYLNAANEVIVAQFLAGEISWVEIAQRLEKLCAKFSPEKDLSLEKILATDTLAREHAKGYSLTYD